MLQEKIRQILIENAKNIDMARLEVSKITKQNFTLFESEGSLFIEFDDPSDMTTFDECVLLEE